MPDTDPHHLQRFIDAQAEDYPVVLAELRRGRKTSHWIWYIFPQVAGLGYSHMAQRYAIQSRAEAIAYLGHPILGPRLTACAQALLPHAGQAIADIMGYPDDLKLCSSMTLFAAIAPPGNPFQAVLDTFYASTPDDQTLAFLNQR